MKKIIIRKRIDQNVFSLNFTGEWAEAYAKEYTKGFKNSYQGKSTQKIGTRIVELIKRDPLSKELTKALESNLALLKSKELEKFGKIILPELPGISTNRSNTFELDPVHMCYDDNNEPEWPEVIRPIVAEIEKKWYCYINTTLHNPVDQEELLGHGTFPVDPLWAVRFNILSPIEEPTMTFKDENGNLLWPIFESNSSLTDKLPIFINLAAITGDNIHDVKKVLGKMVDKYLKKYKLSQYKKPSSNSFIPVFYDKDLQFLYNIRKEDTFQDKLQYYDWHIKEGIDFRHIAVLKNTRKLNPELFAERLDEFIYKKSECGACVKGEESVEKGIKKIYRAIHRKPYNRKEIPIPDLPYNCPDHSNRDDCSRAKPPCKYLKKYLGRFNRLHTA